MALWARIKSLVQQSQSQAKPFQAPQRETLRRRVGRIASSQQAPQRETILAAPSPSGGRSRRRNFRFRLRKRGNPGGSRFGSAY
jgi:hypothetical protein